MDGTGVSSAVLGRVFFGFLADSLMWELNAHTNRVARCYDGDGESRQAGPAQTTNEDTHMGWPLNDDGTVDWETVFEDPDIGLITYVQRARTLVALGQCAHVIVQSLFIRDEDGPYREAFNTMVDEIISGVEDKDADHARETLIKLIREIKANRIKHARNYLQSGATQDGERRDTDIDHTEALQALNEVSGA